MVELDSNEVVDGDVGAVVEWVGDGTGLLGVQIIEEVARRARPRVGISTTAGDFKSVCIDCIGSLSGGDGCIGTAGVPKGVAATAEAINCLGSRGSVSVIELAGY